jgi:hypothetical protein
LRLLLRLLRLLLGLLRLLLGLLRLLLGGLLGLLGLLRLGLGLLGLLLGLLRLGLGLRKKPSYGNGISCYAYCARRLSPEAAGETGRGESTYGDATASHAVEPVDPR